MMQSYYGEGTYQESPRLFRTSFYRFSPTQGTTVGAGAGAGAGAGLSLL